MTQQNRLMVNAMFHTQGSKVNYSECYEGVNKRVEDYACWCSGSEQEGCAMSFSNGFSIIFPRMARSREFVFPKGADKGRRALLILLCHSINNLAQMR